MINSLIFWAIEKSEQIFYSKPRLNFISSLHFYRCIASYLHFVFMDPPLKPNESDCCNSGCNPCILDVYEEQLRKYNQFKVKHFNFTKRKNCLLPTVYSIFSLRNKEADGSDAFLFTFEFVKFVKRESTESNLKVIYNPGQYLMLKAGPKNEEFQRPYTPLLIEGLDDLKFTVLIKLYENGKMSTYLRRLNLGSETIWRGPYGNLLINYSFKYTLFLAQGVGISSLFSVICNMLKNEECETFLKLYYCCKNYDLIYLRNYLYDLQKHWNFTYEVFLSNFNGMEPKYNETIHNYKLNEKVVKEYLEDKYEYSQVLICGSEKYMKYFKEIVLKLNVDEKNIFIFEN